MLVKFRATNKKERWSHQGWHQDWRIGRRLEELPPSVSYRQPFAGNYVVIRHDDGTFGQYAHLKQEGVLVKLGQRVSAGDAIGLSGNTGWSSEPHLHFEVFHAVDGKTQVTLPIEWDAPEKKSEE